MNETTAVTPPATAATEATGRGGTLQFMSFRLGEQAYGVDIHSVQEIRRFSAPSGLPDAPPHLLGVINLRGAVVPVFDLRVRFKLSDTSIGRLTVIIVVVVGQRSVGLVVDEVTRVLRVPTGGLRPAPSLAGKIDTSFVVGLAAQDKGGLVTILDAAKLVTDELGEVAA